MKNNVIYVTVLGAGHTIGNKIARAVAPNETPLLAAIDTAVHLGMDNNLTEKSLTLAYTEELDEKPNAFMTVDEALQKVKKDLPRKAKKKAKKEALRYYQFWKGVSEWHDNMMNPFK